MVGKKMKGLDRDQKKRGETNRVGKETREKEKG